MQEFLKPQFIIPVLIAVIAFVLWFIWDRHKNKGKSKKQTDQGEITYNPIQAIVYDRTTIPFSWYEATIASDEVKKLVLSKNIGRQLNYMGKKVFRLFKLFDADNKVCYEGVWDPSELKNSPTSSYIHMQHPYVPIIDDMKEEKNFAQKYGHLMLWAGIIAFLILLIITNK
jgi:hypothetical protein